LTRLLRDGSLTLSRIRTRVKSSTSERRIPCELHSISDQPSVNGVEQSPPLPIGRAPGLRLDLAPISAFSGVIGAIAALADDPFEASLLTYAQQRQAFFEGFG